MTLVSNQTVVQSIAPEEKKQDKTLVPEIDRGKLARDVLEMIYAPLKMSARLQNERISKNPIDTGRAFKVTLHAGLINRNRSGTGSLRVVVTVPKSTDSKDVSVSIWWTRAILRYWWTKDIVLKGAVDDKAKQTSSELVRVIGDVQKAIDRTVIRKTMDHAYRLVKKSGGDLSDAKKVLKKAGFK